jgi:Fe-S cluster biosynthesis and repair protein YggX
VSPIAIILENLVMYFRSYICTYLDKDFAKIGLGKFLSESFKVFFTYLRLLEGWQEWQQTLVLNGNKLKLKITAQSVRCRLRRLGANRLVEGSIH